MASLHVSGAIEPPSTVNVTIDGQRATGRAGEMVAVTLLANGVRQTGLSAVAGTPRGAFCLMGVCQSCLVSINGAIRRGCVTALAAGMVISTHPAA